MKYATQYYGRNSKGDKIQFLPTQNFKNFITDFINNIAFDINPDLHFMCYFYLDDYGNLYSTYKTHEDSKDLWSFQIKGLVEYYGEERYNNLISNIRKELNELMMNKNSEKKLIKEKLKKKANHLSFKYGGFI